jgi:hypothetical protein
MLHNKYLQASSVDGENTVNTGLNLFNDAVNGSRLQRPAV